MASMHVFQVRFQVELEYLPQGAARVWCDAQPRQCAQLLLVPWLQQLIIDSVVHQHSRVTWLKSERIVLITGTGNDIV